MIPIPRECTIHGYMIVISNAGRKINMKTIMTCYCIFAMVMVTTVAMSEDSIMKAMNRQAEIVSHVKILDVRGGGTDEEGVQEWQALCQVMDPLKGEIAEGEKIRFRFNRFVFLKNEEPMIVQKGQQYVIFLKGKSGEVRFPSDQKLEVTYELVDRWVGVVQYNFHLVRKLRIMEKDNE